jgi:CubicO group peptidase (beta-lactamase class C family)
MSAKFVFNCLKFSLLTAFLLNFQTPSFSQKKTPAKSTLPAMDLAIEEKKNLLGKDFSVVIATADSVVYEKTIGDVSNLKTPVPIGASSQWLTTAFLLQLVDEGKISLDDPVAKYLPVFEKYRRNFITLRHCLTHQTGLGREAVKASGILDKDKYSSFEEKMTDLLKKEIHANAGQEFRYGNYGMMIAAAVAEVVTKKRFDQIIRTRLFVPLGMRNTSFSTDDGSAPNPSIGARSTAADMTKFLQMLLNKGRFGGKQVLTEAAVEELRKVQVAASQTKIIPKANAGFAYALGSWSTDESTATGAQATQLVLPSLAGTWPMIDFAKGYTFLVFGREFSGEQGAGVYRELKEVADRNVRVKK